MAEVVSTHRGFLTEKETLFFSIHCQKIAVDEKSCLETSEGKFTHRKRHGLKNAQWKLALSKIKCTKIFKYRKIR